MRPAAAALSEQALPGLKRRMIRAGGYTVAGQVSAQALRLGGNLVLTRLLFPEAFGVMAIVQAVLAGLALMSDVGTGASIVQNKQGSHRAFLDTAWTIQIIRGFIIYACAAAAAGPLAAVYGEPLLRPLLLVAALSALVSGFDSTKLALAHRELRAGRVIAIELGSYALGLTATVAWAWFQPTVWALVWGSILGASLRMIASHLLLEGRGNRLALEPGAARSVVSFGKWILLGSCLTFLAGEGNRLLVAGFMDLQLLACFVLAITLTAAPTEVVQQIAARVAFPAYAAVQRDAPARLYETVKKSRLVLLIALWIAPALLVLAGQPLMSFLYDARYADSGWMLRVLAAGGLVGGISTSYNGLLLAKGEARIHSVALAIQTVLQACGVTIGGLLFGTPGVVGGLALAWWLMYPVYAVIYARLSLWQPEIDFPVLLASVLLVGTALAGARW